MSRQRGIELTLPAAREALASIEGAVLSPEEIADIVAEPGWAAVLVAREGIPRSQLAVAHRQLSEAFPGVALELRADRLVYRGGEGFGEGRYVVAVLGGKGGVGKSTLAVNLALTLSAMGVRTGLLDGDLNAPDIPHLVGVHQTAAPRGLGWQLSSTKVTPRSKRRPPHQRFGVEVMSVGFVTPERLPVVIGTRTLLSSLMRYLVFEVAWDADVLLVDCPPGTGEEIQVLCRELPLSGAVFVTTPQDLAQMDAERSLTLLTDHDVPVIGWVQNMAAMTCPHCERDIDLFARSARLSEAGLPVLGRIPFDLRLAVTADQGLPLVLGDPRGPVAYEFACIATHVRRWLAEREVAADG